LNCNKAAAHTHEEIVCVRDVTADAEQLHQIVELAMDIAAYLRAPGLAPIQAPFFLPQGSRRILLPAR
jgi:hypothetical protein